MCGIAGLIDRDAPPDEATLRAIEARLARRGPDEGGVWRAGPAGLVHRRLRVIDLSPLGAQPMGSADGQTQVVFNGEIYNHRALRAELEAMGFVFRGRSDTEVLVHGHAAWGEGLVSRLRGMFAFAVWHAPTGRLLLARDRLGKKPLFYGVRGGRLVFASELDVFKCVPGWPIAASLASFGAYLTYGYVPGEGTMLDGVHRLAPGHLAVFDGRALRVEPYWRLPVVTPGGRDGGWGRAVGARAGSVDEAARALEPALREAVACRLESDVPLGCFLSGGVDSSLVTALAQQQLGRRLATYTVGWQGSPLSEAAHARRVARRLGTEHHEVLVSAASLLDDLEATLGQASEPIGDDSFVPTALLARATRAHVTVALTGDGGDELFAGYDRYRQLLAARPFARPALRSAWSTLAWLAPFDGLHKRAAALASPDEPSLARWLVSLFKPDEVDAMLSLAARAGGAAPPGDDPFARRWRELGALPTIERFTLVDVATYLEGDVLVKVDRASMGVGLETRSPLLDAPFVEQALRWPVRARLPGGGKAVLRAMLARHLPAAWFERPKQGFGLPGGGWYRRELRPLLLRYTAPERLRRRGLLRPDVVSSMVQAHLAGARNYARKLHALVAFEIWADSFFGPDAPLA